jgi:Mg-chelatase subunit ChlD
MSALVTALDSYTPKQIGENGHVEYGWSNDIREKIAQFSFQLTRTNEDGLKRLQNILNSILISLKSKIDSSNIIEREVGKGLLSTLYRMIGYTRDIIDGKGEYTLAYMMIYTWYKFYPELAKFALKCLVDLGDTKVHQYGSWKDMKYFCNYCKEQQQQQQQQNSEETDHQLITYAIELMNEQLKNDYTNYTSNNNASLTLVARWIPREKSSFSWLYEKLAINYFPNYIRTAPNIYSKQRAVIKCKTEYRKIISLLNKHIDTLQIKQCGLQWSTINFNNVTSISLSKQKKAFLNINKKGETRYPDNKDRITCATSFNTHIQKAVNGETEMKGKRVSMADFTKQALDPSISQAEKDLLNSQWRDNSSQTGALGNMIAMVDVSGSMDGDPMDVAIALGIRIAEKSVLGKRVLTFSASPRWINLEPYPDFVSQAEFISGSEWGMNTNFEAALNMILDAIIQNKMEPEDVQDMILVILSDMQMDKGDETYDKDTLYKKMEKKYQEAGIRVHGKPYKPPHILFWNLRSTTGFPTLSNQANASMMSGFSPALLNLFCEQGFEALQSCSAWSILERSLDNSRYKIMSNKLNQEIIV